MDNKSVAELFLEMAELLDIEGGDPYRVRTFRRVAHLLEELAEPVAEALRFGTLQRRRGIGEGTLSRLRELLRTGRCLDLERLRARVPGGVRELLKLDGLGPRTVRLIHTYLGVRSIDELEAAANAGRLQRLPRFGPATTERILASIATHRLGQGRISLPVALRLGGAVVAGLAADPAVEQAALAGSARRGKELVGDLDVLIASTEPARCADRFCSLPEIGQVLQRGSTRIAARLCAGPRIDLRVLVPETFGAGLHYFTGSKRHNIAIRARGNRRGLKISEYGVFERASLRRLAGSAEADIFASVGLPFIPPELREDDGEIEAAENGRLPRLVELSDLRGDLGVHSRASDGADSAPAMAAAALGRGLSYLALTDHASSPTRAGLSGASLLGRRARLRGLAARFQGLRVLCGCEVEILPDGALALDPALLARLDWVTASAHDHLLEQSPAELTRRLVRAMESGVVDCLGHPTGRCLGRSEPIALELDLLLGAARRCGVALALDAHPSRLDLPAAACREARAASVPIAISSGAHAASELGQLELGVVTARRGWLERRDLLNCLTAEELLDRRRQRLRRGSRPVGKRHATRSERLALELGVGPLSSELRERILAWLGHGDDAELSAALAQISEQPMQKALELLCQDAPTGSSP